MKRAFGSVLLLLAGCFASQKALGCDGYLRYRGTQVTVGVNAYRERTATRTVYRPAVVRPRVVQVAPLVRNFNLRVQGVTLNYGNETAYPQVGVPVRRQVEVEVQSSVQYQND